MLKATEQNVHHPFTALGVQTLGKGNINTNSMGTSDLQTSPGPRPTTHHQTPFILHGCHQLLTAKTRSIPCLYGCFRKKRGTPKSSILIGFSIINHPFWGTTIFGNTHIAGLLPYLAMSFRRKPGKTELLRGFSTTFHLHLACYSWRIPDTTHPGPLKAVKKICGKNHLGK